MGLINLSRVTLLYIRFIYLQSGLLHFIPQGSSSGAGSSKCLHRGHLNSGLVIKINKEGNTEIDNTSTTGAFNLKVAGDVNVEGQNEIIVSSGPTGAIRLISGDGTTNLWQPNMLPNCLFTGAPHGGPAAGINGLKGN